MGAREELANVLAKALPERGFRRRGDSWGRLGTALYSVVNLQRSRWDSPFYVNIGFAPADHATRGWLAESKCVVRFRIEAIRAISVEDLRLLDDDALAAMGGPAWSAAVSHRVVEPIVAVLDRATDLDGLRHLLRTDVSERVMVEADMRVLLESPR